MTSQDNYWIRRLQSGGVSRRGFVGGAALAGVGAAGLGLVGCGGDSTSSSGGEPTTKPGGQTGTATPAGAPKRGGTLKTTINGDPPSLDPFLNLSYRSQGVASFVYSRLFRIESGPDIAPGDLRVTPDVAASREIPDTRTFTVKLKPGVKWQNVPPLNGRPLTSADVKYSFERFMALSPNRTSLASVEGVQTPDDSTVTFKLKTPMAPLEFYLGSPTHLYLMPREVIEADGDANKRMIGTGPLILEKYEPSSVVKWRRNPDYHVAGQPSVDGVDWIIIADAATATANIRSGQLDVGGIPSADVESAKQANPKATFTSYQPFTCNSLWFDVTKPPFDDIRVRQAASMAIDRQGLVAAAYNGKGAVQNAIPAGYQAWTLAANDPEMGTAKRYLEHNVKDAKDLLAQAGYGNGLTTTLSGTTGYGATNNQVMELLAEMLKEAGINANLVMKEYAAHIATTFVGKFTGMAGGIGSTFFEPDDLLTSLYSSTSPRRNTLVNDPKVDDLILKQRQELDAPKRKQIINQLQKYLVEQAYLPPTAAGDVFVVSHPWVKNYFPKSTGSYDSQWISRAWIDRG